jgi:hypothetical protein
LDSKAGFVADSGPRFGLPGLRYRFALGKVIYDKTKPIGVIAINHLDIDACVCHPAGDHSELAGNVLPQLLNENFANIEDLDPYNFESFTGGLSILEKEMHRRLAVGDPTASALDTYTGGT